MTDTGNTYTYTFDDITSANDAKITSLKIVPAEDYFSTEASPLNLKVSAIVTDGTVVGSPVEQTIPVVIEERADPIEISFENFTRQADNSEDLSAERNTTDTSNISLSSYEKIASEEKIIDNNDQISKLENTTSDDVTIVTKNKTNEVMQIIYFDFDKFNLSNVSKNKIKSFIINNGSQINEYLVIGHTDTKGSKNYNLSLSIKRAEVVKEILIDYGIKRSSIKILGRGEETLAIQTPDDTKQPANRRVEIKKTN